LKRRKDREYYARNKDEIQKRRRQARENKQASTSLPNDMQNVQHTSPSNDDLILHAYMSYNLRLHHTFMISMVIKYDTCSYSSIS
jgi:hypothetical protein